MKKNSTKTEDTKLPEVIPYFQTATLGDGENVTKRFKPLSYAMLCWLKMNGEKDSIDISDDENSAQYEFSMDSMDQSFKYKCYFNTYEENGLITYCIYYLEAPFNISELGDEIYKLLAEINLQLQVGQFQFVGDGDEKTLRYYSSIDLKGVASEDPDYEGPFHIYPRSFERLFTQGANAVNLYIDNFISFNN